MKQTVKLLSMIFAIGSLAFFMSCGKDDGGIVIDTDLAVSFSTTSATVAEGESVTVTVSFPAAPTAVTLTASVNSSSTATYSDDYTTTPAVANSEVSISVAKDATSASFTFMAASDDIDETDENVTFDLVAADGIQLGSNTSFTVTITDVISYDDIENVRAAAIDTEVIVKGVVTSPDYGFNDGNFFVQDGTGGIFVFYDDNQGAVSRGDEVVIEGTRGEFSGIVQLAATSVVVTGETVTFPSLQVIAEGDLTTSSNLQGSLVQISGVYIEEDEWPTDAISSGSGVNVSAKVGTTDFFLRIDRGESFYDGSPIPGEPLSVNGILHRFNDDVQIMPFVDGDVDAQGSLGLLNITESLTAFDATANGSISSEQSFTVSGTDIVGDVTITSSQYFTISTQSEEPARGSTSFSNEIVLSDVSSAQTIYVRFEPSSGVNGTLNGTVSASASNSLSTSISVSGEETGNGASADPTDLFFSEYIEGSSSNKYLEIYNGTGSSIDLSDYEIHRYNNGASADPSTYALAGSINSGDVIVIANSSGAIYSGTIYSATDVNGATFYNGDDVLVLYKVSSSSNIDIIGHLGCDPGSAWASGDHSTANKTLRRKNGITTGVTTHFTGTCGSDSFETLVTEWDVYDTDDASGLGSHSHN